MFNYQRKAFINHLAQLSRGIGLDETWVSLTLRENLIPWDLYSASKEVALAMFAQGQLDPWLSTYLRLCREHAPGKVEFLPEDN
jgi:hypothetical protein